MCRFVKKISKGKPNPKVWETSPCSSQLRYLWYFRASIPAHISYSVGSIISLGFPPASGRANSGQQRGWFKEGPGAQYCVLGCEEEVVTSLKEGWAPMAMEPCVVVGNEHKPTQISVSLRAQSGSLFLIIISGSSQQRMYHNIAQMCQIRTKAQAGLAGLHQ